MGAVGQHSRIEVNLREAPTFRAFISARAARIHDCAFVCICVPGLAQTDEIQVYDAEIAPPGVFNFTLPNPASAPLRTTAASEQSVASALTRPSIQQQRGPDGLLALSRCVAGFHVVQMLLHQATGT